MHARLSIALPSVVVWVLGACGGTSPVGDFGADSGSATTADSSTGGGSSSGSSSSGADSASTTGSSSGAGLDSGAPPNAASDAGSDGRPISVAEGGPDATVLDAGAPSNPTFILGADITSTQRDVAGGATFVDNGVQKPVLQLFKDHGFNYIRLRTFVDPTQAAPNPAGGTFAPYSTQGFADLAHTVTFGQQIKAAGMGFLLDFHYSDTWADPGKQVKPNAWANDTLAAAVTHLHDYTLAAIQQLVAAGARPDMVQIGNEITPGMLWSPGIALGPSSTAGWPQLAQLLKAGISAVRQVDPTIKIMLHIDRGGDFPGTAPGNALNSSIAFINNAIANGVVFDVFGESCYLANQGPPSGWQTTFSTLATRFPNLKFAIAEYNVDPANPTGPEVRQANDIMFQLPNHVGMGTFFWDPTHTNPSPGMFTTRGNVYTVIPAVISQYDQMRTAYGL